MVKRKKQHIHFLPANVSLYSFMLVGSIVLLFFITVSLLLPGILRLPLHIHINYNEGWNAYHTKDVMMGKSLYSVNVLTPVNYPPFSFYIIGALASVFGDPLFIGRIVAFLSLIGIAMLVSYLVFLKTRQWYASIFSGLLLLSLFGLLGADYIGMDDPQLLGNFLLLIGLLLYVRCKNIFLASLCMVLAVFIKDSILALPIAMTIYVFLTERKYFLHWCIYGIVLLGSMLVATQIVTHNLFLSSLFIGRRYDLSNAVSLFETQVLPITILLGLGLFFTKKLSLFWLYLVMSLCIGLYFSFGYGTGINMYFDTYIALSLVLGVSITKFQSVKKIVIICTILLNIAVGFGLKLVFHRLNFYPQMLATSEQRDIEFIKKFHGNVLCEYIDYCYYAGKPFVYDPFLVNELIVEKKIPESNAITLLEKKKFSLVQLTNPVDAHYFEGLPPTKLTPIKNKRFTENFYRALGNNYHQVSNSENVFFFVPN